MKIALAVNTFDTDLNRFKLANQSYERLDKLDNVDVFDIQKPGVKGLFKTVDRISRHACDVVEGSTAELPFVNDLFNIAADLDYDYFIFTNADVMISPTLIKHILDNDITAMPCSRLDVMPGVEKINEPLTPIRWEVAGLDTFCFKTDWYKKYSVLFEDFILGKPVFDQHYAALMKVFGNNDIIGNKNPAFCCHEFHGISAVTTKCVERTYNFEQYQQSELAQTYKHVWDDFLPKLLNRTGTFSFGGKLYNSFLNEINNESQIERDFFNLNNFLLQSKKKEHIIKYNLV